MIKFHPVANGAESIEAVAAALNANAGRSLLMVKQQDSAGVTRATVTNAAIIGPDNELLVKIAADVANVGLYPIIPQLLQPGQDSEFWLRGLLHQMSTAHVLVLAPQWYTESTGLTAFRVWSETMRGPVFHATVI